MTILQFYAILYKVIIMIKETLKKYGITLTQFANTLNISRPTLDTYIRLYESGQALPNDKYKFLFDSVFNDKIENEIDFQEQLDRAHYLLQRDDMLGTMDLDAEKTDYISIVIDLMKKDMFKENTDLNLYRFIVLYISSYYENPVMSSLCKYFLVLNGKLSIKQMTDEDKIYFPYYMKLFKSQLLGKLQCDEMLLKEFYDRVEEINQKENRQKDALKNSIMIQINTKINELLNHGLKTESINVEQLVSSIKNEER